MMINNTKGLTLFEIIIAMSITSLFFIMASMVLINIQTTYHRINLTQDQHSELNQIVTLIDKTVDSYNHYGIALHLDDDRLLDASHSILFFTGETNQLSYRLASWSHVYQLPLKHPHKIHLKTHDDLLIVMVRNDAYSIRVVYHIFGGIT